ncbi:MAG: radical SAM protein [Candidatus Bathyarchaeota archaeon]|jgi:MoaA/NifB/PqqE/SkfB family radical SAM enzyme|nr:radical SAM protein [Candidatus Termiticorpusculum sp.]
MIPQVATFFISYQCNFTCDHCSISSSPSAKTIMSDELMESIFEQIKKVPSFKVVVFTGGETTLQKEKLIKGLNISRGNGLLPRVVTNAWWATTKDAADKFVKELVVAGLNEINTSFDDYHAQFMSIDNIVHFAEAALNNGIKPAISTVIDNYSKYNSKYIQAYMAEKLNISPSEINKKIFFMESKPSFNGRGANLKNDVDRIPTCSSRDEAKIGRGCSEVGRAISFHPDGTIKICCGHASRDVPDLSVGDLYSESLETILGKIRSNIVFWLIHTLGPSGMLEKLAVAKGNYFSPCDACYDLLVNYRKEMLEYVINHKDELLLNDVLLTDNKRRELSIYKTMVMPQKVEQ